MAMNEEATNAFVGGDDVDETVDNAEVMEEEVATDEVEAEVEGDAVDETVTDDDETEVETAGEESWTKTAALDERRKRQAA